MNKRSARLMLVTRLAELREQQRLAELARARNEEQQQRSSLEQLRNYREEYCRQIERGGSGIGGAAHMANFMRFISDIDAASELQQRHVDWRKVREKYPSICDVTHTKNRHFVETKVCLL